MQQCWIVIYIAAAVIAAHGYVQDLRVDVIPVQTRFSAVQGVNVILKYSNMGDDTMAIYKWNLPQTGLFDPLFEVTLDGEHVEYVGPMVKRRAPTADDVIFLTPGMTVRTVVQLSSVYNMTQSGNYIIQYKTTADQMLFTMNSMLKHEDALFDADQGTVIESAPIVVFSVGHRNLLIEQANEANTRTRVLAPTYSSCSASQTNSIRTAMTAAASYATNAAQYFTSQSSSTARYTNWFGSHSSTNWLALKSRFTSIKNVLDTKTISFDCSCPGAGPQTYAYVYANQHYKVYLCNVFWSAPTTGTDTQGGTIVHEVAHFQIVAGTQDHAYGHSLAKSLAKSDPSKAIINSDSLQYFAENNPRLN